MSKQDFTQYVHEWTASDGSPRFAVGEWLPQRAEFHRVFDLTEYRLTGCSAEFSKRPSGLQSFTTRRQALRRARYLYDEQGDW